MATRGETTEWHDMQVRLGNRPNTTVTEARGRNWRDPAEVEEEKRKERMHRLVMNNLDQLEEVRNAAAPVCPPRGGGCLQAPCRLRREDSLCSCVCESMTMSSMALCMPVMIVLRVPC